MLLSVIDEKGCFGRTIQDSLEISENFVLLGYTDNPEDNEDIPFSDWNIDKDLLQKFPEIFIFPEDASPELLYIATSVIYQADEDEVERAWLLLDIVEEFVRIRTENTDNISIVQVMNELAWFYRESLN